MRGGRIQQERGPTRSTECEIGSSYLWRFTSLCGDWAGCVNSKLDQACGSAWELLFSAVNSVVAGRFLVAVYFVAREATIFSKSGSPRSESHCGWSLRKP